MKIGETYLSELLGDRFDVPFQMGFNACTSLIKHHPYKPLGEIAEFSSESWNQKSIFADIFPYIEIGNVDITTGEISAIEPISIKDAPSRAKKIVRKNDILVSTTRPNRGAICLYEQDEISIASTGFSIIRNIDNNIIRDFLFVMLRMPFSLEQMQLRSSGGNYPAIIESELKKILIPIPQKEVQEHIINIYSQAQQARLEKRQEAKQLLESIDDYLLEALQIEKKQQKKEKRSQALRNISSIIGGRLDVPFLKGIEDAITEIKRIQHKTLGEIADFASENWDQKSLFEGRFPYVEISAIDTTMGEISAVEDIPMSNPPSRAKKILRKNDILISTTRPNRGAICIYSSDSISIASTGFSIIRNVKDNILKEYLLIILRSSISLKQMELRSSGGNYPAIIESELKRIIIPTPPVETQNTIINEICSMKDKAKQLLKEGDDLLAEAKQKIEKMIIG